ncbi:MAG: S8 family serine peptidase [Deltaproteobacteria bacterium]|nr:S8 family serine peptidase [Deltaproteobacteria bacterium]
MSSKRAAFLLLVFGFWSIVHSPWSMVHASSFTKVDPLIPMLAKQIRTRTPGLASKAISLNEAGERVIDCFVVVYDPSKTSTIADRIKAQGGQVRSTIDTVMTAFLPLNAVNEISGWSEIKYIEAGKPMRAKNDTARTATGVDSVSAGTGLDKRYDGSGVIVGVVDDTLIDWGHADFTDASGKTRFLFFWDKSISGSGVSEISGSTGVECTAAQINASTCTATAGGDTTSHGTHVMGSATGDDATYKGVAPGANLVGVYNVETDASSSGNLSTTIVDDVKYIFAKATAQGLPAVVNLSLGTSIGAHDNTSSMETGLNNLVSGDPGRAIANAAGNENFMTSDSGAATYAGIHATVDVTSATNRAFDFAVRSGASLGSQVIIDVWLASTSTCTVDLGAFDFAKTGELLGMSEVAAGASGTASGTAGTSGTVTLSIDFTDSSNANNGKKHASATITFNSAVTNAQIQALSFDLIFRGNCTGDAWLWPDANSILSFTKRFGGTDRGFGYTYIDGDSNKTITIPATASGLIAVGSWMDRTTWVDSTGVTHYQTATSGTDFTSLGATGGTADNISLFSSLGPTADSRTKPDLVGPGEAVVSSLSLNNAVLTGRIVNSKHFKLEGTSMSSPHVAGIVALMFQRNPCLTSNQVKTILTGNTTTDSFTGTSLPNNIWGYGKVNALAAMKGTTGFSGTCGTTGPTGAPTTPVTTTSGEAAGGGGCSLNKIKDQKSKIWKGTLLFWLRFFCLY